MSLVFDLELAPKMVLDSLKPSGMAIIPLFFLRAYAPVSRV